MFATNLQSESEQQSYEGCSELCGMLKKLNSEFENIWLSDGC